MFSDFCVFQFLWRSVGGKHLTRLQSDNAAFKFFWRSLDGGLGNSYDFDQETLCPTLSTLKIGGYLKVVTSEGSIGLHSPIVMMSRLLFALFGSGVLADLDPPRIGPPVHILSPSADLDPLRYQYTPKSTILQNFSYWYSQVHLFEFF